MAEQHTYKELEIKIQALEQAASEDEEKHRLIVDTIPHGVQEIDASGKIIFANSAYHKMLGYDEKTLIGMSMYDMLLNSDKQKELYDYIQIIKGKQPKPEPWFGKIIKKNGDILDVQTDWDYKRNKQREVVGFISIISDITERKQAEEALKKSEEKYRSFFENSSVSLWEEDYSAVMEYLNGLCDSDVKDIRSYFNDYPEEVAKCASLVQILDVNPATIEMFEAQNKDDLIGNLNSVFTEDSLEVFKEELISFSESNMLFQSEGIAKTITGKRIFIHLTVSLLSKHKVLISITDITKRKQAEEILEKAHVQLEKRVDERTLELRKTYEQLLHAEKLAAIGGLSASIAHEFKNHLYGIMAVIKGVKQTAPLDEEDANLIDMAINECDRMKDLIMNLQDFNRPTSGKVAPIDIHASIDNILLLSNLEFIIKNIKVKTNYAKNMPEIKAVADQIKQVILNLLNNAAYACEEGGKITINTKVVNKKNCVIQIHDTGIGIEPEHMDKIFESFFTTKPLMKGSGLGLSISDGIIKKHGGQIDVASEPGKGATFTIILPIERVRNA